jgi:hypothetical protein
MLLLAVVTQSIYLTLSTAGQVCADNPRTHHDFEAEHKHVVAFATAQGRVEDGDYFLFDVNGHESDRLSATGTVTLDFPAGLGEHVIAAKWFRHDGKVKREASTSLHVYPWSACR